MRALFALLARRDRSGQASALLESTWLGACYSGSAARPYVLALAPALTSLPPTAPAPEAPCTSGAALPWAVRPLLGPEGLRGLATSANEARSRSGGSEGRSATRSRPGAMASSSGGAPAGSPAVPSPSPLLPASGRSGGGQRGAGVSSGDRGAPASGHDPGRDRLSHGADATHRSTSAPPSPRGPQAVSGRPGRSASAPPRVPPGDRGATAAEAEGAAEAEAEAPRNCTHKSRRDPVRPAMDPYEGSARRSHSRDANHRSASAPLSPRGRNDVSHGQDRGASAPPPSSRGGGRGPSPIDTVKACRDLGELEALVEAGAGDWSREGHIKAFNTALNLTAKLPTTDTAARHRVFRSLAAAYLPLVEGLPDAATCTIPLHACAKAGYWGGGLAAALLQRLSADGGALLVTANEQALSNLWWSLSAALDSAEGQQRLLSSIVLPRLLEASAECLLAMPITRAQHCSNVLLACARLQLSNERLAHHLTARLVELGAEAKPQELANSLYALGELAEDVGHTPRPEDLQGLARAVAGRLTKTSRDGFKPQELSNMLLGCARLRYTDPALLRPLAAAAAGAAPSMNPQQLANSLYSLALLQPSVSAHGGAVEALAQECKRRHFSGFNPQNMANSAWALAKLRYLDQGWYAAAVDAAAQPGPMREGTPQSWSNLWYALALVRHQPASGRLLLGRTAEAAGGLRQGVNAQACANLLWALANLQLYDKRLVDALAGRLSELLGQDLKQLTGQGLCNSLWSLAVMGPDVLSRHSGLVEGLLREAERRWAAESRKAFSEDGLRQLWYVQLELAHVGGGELQRILGAGAGRQGSLLGAARAAAERQAAEEAKASPFERQVASALERLAERLGPGTLVSVQRGCVVPGLGRAADIVVELAGGRRVAVEVDGPSHFFANRPRDRRAVDGRTALRNRQLGRVYAQVLSVPYWDWDDCKSAAQREELLRVRLGLGDGGKEGGPAGKRRKEGRKGGTNVH